MEKKKINLSVAIATYNEADTIKRCLLSIKSIADEIVVVDGGSKDTTVDIAKTFGSVVIQTDNPHIFHVNKQKAITACHGTWILQLDADEEVSDELRSEIQTVIRMTPIEIERLYGTEPKNKLFKKHQKIVEARDGEYGTKHGEIVAFFIARKNYFLGTFMTYAGMYPDGVIRLVKRGFATFPAKSVHEQIHITGRVSWLHHDLLHYSNPTLKKYLLGAYRYTTLLSEQMKDRKEPITIYLLISYVCIKPIITFFTLFIRHKGFLDGIHGFLFSLFSALHYPVAFYKYVKHQQN